MVSSNRLHNNRTTTITTTTEDNNNNYKDDNWTHTRQFILCLQANAFSSALPITRFLSDGKSNLWVWIKNRQTSWVFDHRLSIRLRTVVQLTCLAGADSCCRSSGSSRKSIVSFWTRRNRQLHNLTHRAGRQGLLGKVCMMGKEDTRIKQQQKQGTSWVCAVRAFYALIGPMGACFGVLRVTPCGECLQYKQQCGSSH